MHPVLFSVFGYPVHTYAAAIATAFVLTVWMAAREAPRFGLDREMILDLCWWLLVMGLVGSRLAFILTSWDQYYYACTDIAEYNRIVPDSPIDTPDCLLLLKFWNGGLVFYGAAIGSLITLFVFMRREKQPALPVADLVIAYLPLGQFFGRLGCLGAGCCFGKPTDAAVGITFPKFTMAWNQHIAEGLIDRHAEHSALVHPTQIYDSLTGLLLFAALMWLRKRKTYDGQVLVGWLVLYPVTRSLNELFRGDLDRKFLTEIVIDPLNTLLGLAPGSVTFLSTSQFISLLVASTGLALWLKLRASR